MPLTSLAARTRWIVIAVTTFDAWQHGRWLAVVGLVVFAILSETTGRLNRCWQQRVADLTDAQAVADGIDAAHGVHTPRASLAAP